MLVVALASWASPISAAEPPSERVVARARARKLWTDPAWLRLLHYRFDVFGEFDSDVDGAAFFLSPVGKSNPRAELEATLRAFYRPLETPPDSHARCRFPARLNWLDQQLDFADELPRISCPRLARHEASLTPATVTLVFAANAVDSPVTAFGHTFLAFSRPGQPNQTGTVIEYTADIDTRNPLFYTFKGLFGMFRGRFFDHPARDKLKYYLDEDRDLWEYELALTQSEIRQLVRHLWELSATHFDYYYMTENCSYGVLALLEASVPRLELIESTKYIVLPVDTVKAVADTPGLVRAIHHRAARRNSSVPLERKAPHLGHGTMRLLLGTGFTSQYDDGFATLGYRIALHDLGDSSAGQLALAQVEFMDLQLRYEAKRRRLTLNELTFAELLALHPLRLGFRPSWRARAHGQRLHDTGCENDDCFAHGLNGSLGLTLATADERVAVFAMADAYVVFSGQLDGIDGSFVRVGVGPYAGIRVEAPDGLVALLSGSWSYLPAQAVGSTYELRGALRASLATDVALGLEALVQPSAIEAQFVSYLYF